MIGQFAEFVIALVALLLIGVAGLLMLLFGALLFAISRNRFYRNCHGGPLPDEAYRSFTEPSGCCDLREPDRTPTVEALERLAALPAVEPEHEGWR